MMRVFLLIFLVTIAGEARSASYTLQMKCPILEKPNRKAKVVCIQPKYSQVELQKKPSTKFILFQSRDCSGYLPTSCFKPLSQEAGRIPTSDAQGTPVTIQQTPETPNAKIGTDVQKVVYQAKHFRIGPLIRADLGIATVGYSSDSETTTNLSVGAHAIFQASGRFGAQATVAYNRFIANRNISNSGVIEDYGSEVRQTYQYVSLALIGTYNLQAKAHQTSKPMWRWDINLGVDFWYPLSATQLNSFGSEQAFNADKLLFGVGGLSWEYPFTPVLFVCGHAHFLYNVTAKDSTSLMGGRMGVALGIAL